MPEWEDCYEILGIDPEANEEEIKRAYRDKVFIFHPDRMAGAPESARQRAEEELKKINRASEVLKDPLKRQQYHSEWLRKSGKTADFRGSYTVPKPKPVVEPSFIHLDKVEPGEIKTASFVIGNIGGPYSRIWFNNPDSWVRVVSWASVNPDQDDELPLRVDIEAESEDWGKSYSEYIRVKLDEEETRVRIELRTKPEPVKVRYTRPTFAPPPPYTPPTPVSVPNGFPVWGKWFLGLVIFGLMVVLIGQVWLSSIPLTQTAPTPPTTEEIKTQQIEEGLEKWRQDNTHATYPNPYPTYEYTVVEGHIWATVGQTANNGLGWIIHSQDKGNTWEVLWEDENVRMIAIHFFNETEGLVATWHDILQTSDGGKTWNSTLTVKYRPERIYGGIASVFVRKDGSVSVMLDHSGYINTLNKGMIWTFHGREIFRTHNAGTTWEKMNNK